MSNRQRPYHHGDLRKALIDKAIVIIEAEGAEQVTLRRLGREVGVSPMAAYRHFESKEDLLQHVARQGFVKLTEVLQKADEGVLHERLLNQGVDYIQFAISHPAHYRVMFSTLNMGDWNEALTRAGQVAFQAMADTITAMSHKYRLRNRLTAAEAALICWSNVHGVAELLLSGKLPDMLSFENFSRKSCRAVAEGLFEL